MPDTSTDLLDLVSWTTHRIELAIAGAGASEQAVAFASSLGDAITRREERPLRVLQERFGLSDTAAQVIWMLAAVELDSNLRFIPLLRNGITLDVIKSVIYGTTPRLDSHNELGAMGTLRRLALIEPVGPAELHDSRQTWAVARRVLTWLHGDPSIGQELRRFARFGKVSDIALAMSEATVAAAREAMAMNRVTIVSSGLPGLGRRSLLVTVARELGHEVLEIDATRLAREPAMLATQLRLIARECRLLARVPLLRNVDALVETNDEARIRILGVELVAEVDGIVLATCGSRRPPMRWDRPVITIDVRAPSSSQRAQLWRAHLVDASESDGVHLASVYPLAPALIEGAASIAQTRATSHGRKVTPSDLEGGVRAVLEDRLGDFARRIEVSQTWDDLVLPADQFRSVIDLVGRIRTRSRVYEAWGFAAKVGRGLGVSALFSGPPGTGKTMVAALIARELGLELYQVDSGKLVSKWIGDTEKHLGELFDAAEAGHAVLLFDEADSLFGKRTDVKSSNDRYANLETNYLLQRLETFTGICLLTSNHESNIDPAFQRRLSLHLRFDVPDQDEREHLWRAMFPPTAPVASNIDFAGLARRFEMTGGYIRNAVLRAAFLAASDDSSITSEHLEQAAALEYEGMGKIPSIETPAWPPRVACSLY